MGKIIMGDDLEKLLFFANIRREPMADNGIMFTRRESLSGSYYFIKNTTDRPFDGWLPLKVNATSAAIFNPMTEKFGMAKKRLSTDGKIEIYSRLLPGESLIIETFNNKVSGKPYSFYNPVLGPQELTGKWKVDFVEGGPQLPASKEVGELISWTEFGGEAFKDFSGTARYTISFKKPVGKAGAWSLELGKVCSSARVILNGKEIAVLIGPDYRVIIDKNQLETINTLEIEVSNLMANRIAYLDRNNIDWKKFYNVNFAARLRENNKNGIFDASAWLPRESGLLGPVTITGMKKR